MIRVRGLTLIETVLSISLLTMLMGGLFQFYTLCLRSREAGQFTTKRALLARSVLEQIAGEIRQAVPTQFDKAIKGKRHELEVLTTSLPSRKLYEFRDVREDILPGEHDVRRVRYDLYWTDEVLTDDGEPRVLGLRRFEQKTLNDPDPTQAQAEDENEEASVGDRAIRLFAHEIKYIEFRYSTGSGGEWLTKWTGKAGGIPKAIRITVGFVQELGMTRGLAAEADLESKEQREELDEDEEIPHPDRYTMQVWLPTATSAVGNVLTEAQEPESDAEAPR